MAYRDIIIADGPVAYWRLGETTGTVAVDETGNHNASYVNSPTIGAPGLLSNDSDTAVLLDGVSHHLLAGSSLLASRSSFTIEAWLKPTAGGVGVRQEIYSEYDASNVARGFFVYFGAGKTIEVVISSDGTSNNRIYAYTNNVIPDEVVADGFHLVVTFDSGTVKTYIKGVEYPMTVDVRGTVNSVYSGSPAPFIGCSADLQSPINNFFNGVIDELAVYHYALSIYNVIGHLNAGTAFSAYSLAGNVLTSAGAAADFVAVFAWPNGARVSVTAPAADGSWGVSVDPGDYGITYLAAGCQPVTHGPYTVE